MQVDLSLHQKFGGFFLGGGGGGGRWGWEGGPTVFHLLH